MPDKDLNIMTQRELQQELIRLKKEKNCFVMAHNYIEMPVQEVSDYVGDSLQMAQVAAQTNYDMILMCSIRIMGEAAKILNPEKKVIMAHKDADCKLANMKDPSALSALKEKHPDAEIVCYVNSPAILKAESTITCTSANCIRIVESIPEDKEIIFIPDCNIGRWVEYKTGRKLIMFDSYCYVHHRVSLEEARQIKKDYPDYTLLVHPECNLEVCKFADIVCSTSQMIDYVKHHDKVIIGTETGLFEQLKAKFPEKKLMYLSSEMLCEDMKKNTLFEAVQSLITEDNEVLLDQQICEKTKKSLNRMFELVR